MKLRLCLPRPRWYIILGLALLILLSIPLQFYLYYEYAGTSDLNAAIAEADRLDPGWRIEELETKRMTVPDEENSAFIVLASKQLLPDPWPSHEFEKLEDSSKSPQQLHPAYLKAVQQELSAVAPALSELRKLIEFPRGRFSGDKKKHWHWTAGGIEHFSTVRGLRTLLELDAKLRAQQGDIDGALRTNLAGLNLSRSLGDEPNNVATMIRTALSRIFLSSLERTLSLGEPSAGTLESYCGALNVERESPLLLTALRADRAWSHRAFTEVRNRQLSRADFRLWMATSFESKEYTGIQTLDGIINRFRDLRSVGPLPQAHADIIRIANAFVEIAKVPEPDQLDRTEKVFNRDDLSPVLRNWLSANQKQFEIAHDHNMVIDCARVGLAAERYRLKHGRWPDPIQELTNGYLKTIPTDSFDGKPIKWKRTADGLVIYSVGLNGKDDNGVLWHEEGDLVDTGFRLWNPEKRRQPPPEKSPFRDEEEFIPETTSPSPTSPAPPATPSQTPARPPL